MDWSIFHKLELEEATDLITDYINFCVDNVVPTKNILHFPNNKLFITKEVKDCINEKKPAFRNKDHMGVAIENPPKTTQSASEEDEGQTQNYHRIELQLHEQ